MPFQMISGPSSVTHCKLFPTHREPSLDTARTRCTASNHKKKTSFYRKAYSEFTELRVVCDARPNLVSDMLMCLRELGLVVHMLLFTLDHRSQCEAVREHTRVAL